MFDSIEIRSASSIALDIWTFVVVARDFKKRLKIDSVHDGGFDVCAGKRDESCQEAIELFFNTVTNPFGFIIIENRILSVASAKETTVKEFGEIMFDRQAASEAVVWKFGAFLADLNLFVGNFIREDKDYFTQIFAANRALAWCSDSTQMPHANESKQA